jgi:hypothetical protein
MLTFAPKVYSIIMETTVVHPPLSNIQVELLKLFSVDISDKELLELRTIMVNFFLERARDKADIIWKAKNYSNEQLMQHLNKQ